MYGQEGEERYGQEGVEGIREREGLRKEVRSRLELRWRA